MQSHGRRDCHDSKVALSTFYMYNSSEKKVNLRWRKTDCSIPEPACGLCSHRPVFGVGINRMYNSKACFELTFFVSFCHRIVLVNP